LAEQTTYSIFTPNGESWSQRPSTDIRVIRTGQIVGTSSPAKPLPVAQPFQLTEIPDAMDKMGWHVAAALLRKWFHHRPKNQAQSTFQKRNGFKEDGSAGYPENRIDRATVKLDWILSFERAAKAFKRLQGPIKLSTTAAIDMMARQLQPYRDDNGRIDALAICNFDIHRLHHYFQFQLIQVDTSSLEKAETFFRATLHHGRPDDLAGALGGFAFYAAIAEAEISKSWLGGSEVSVTKVALYMKNPYSFFDDLSDGGSQYLGHWNKDGIALVPFAFIAQKENFGSWSTYPIQPEGEYGRTFWPIHNADFRRWQDEHNAGGDMILYSDCRVMDIKPITFRI
jgi:hypothetical protein